MSGDRNPPGKVIVQRNLQEMAIKWLHNYNYQASIKWMQGYTKVDEYEDIFIKSHEFIRDPIKRHLSLGTLKRFFIFQTLRLKKHEKIRCL